MRSCHKQTNKLSSEQIHSEKWSLLDKVVVLSKPWLQIQVTEGVGKAQLLRAQHHGNLEPGSGFCSLFLVWTKKMVLLRGCSLFWERLSSVFMSGRIHQPLPGTPVFPVLWTPAYVRPWEPHSHFFLPGTEMLTALLHRTACPHFS